MVVMSFFFIDSMLEPGIPATITGETAHHIGTVRRMKAGTEIMLQDPSGARYLVRIESSGKRELVVLPLSPAPIPAPPQRRVSLLQAHIAEQKLDIVLQKATELGAARIIVWQAEHSPHEIAAERIAHKRERFTAIMRNACEQSGRPNVPELIFADSLATALADTGSTQHILLDAAGTDTIVYADNIALIVGPEGGFSDTERELCAQRSIPILSIGAYTLRAETAAIAGLTTSLC